MTLSVDWKALGIDAARARLVAPAIEGFQPGATLAPDDRVRVEPGKGWLLTLEAR